MSSSNLRRRRLRAVLLSLTVCGIVGVFVVAAGPASATVQVVSIAAANDANKDGVFTNTENVAKNATYPDTVTFQLTLSNTTLTAPAVIRLSDASSSTLASSMSPSCASINNTTLAPMATATCYYDVSIGSAGSSAFSDMATVRWGNGGDFASANSMVNFPSLTVTKSSTTTQVSAVGQIVPYSYLVTNTGTVTVTGINVSDNNVDSAPTCPGTSLASGASMTCTAQHTATVGEIAAGSVNNTVTVTSNEAANATDHLSIPAALPSLGGMFVVGDLTVGPIGSATGESVTFWGAQWWKLNQLSGGTGPAAFKGFEDSPAAPTCGVNWTTDPGNSTPPPASIPDYIGVIVSSSIAQNGSTIGGDTQHIVIVQTNPGYQGNPGHAGTGTIVAVVC
jgi:hypothetical protein